MAEELVPVKEKVFDIISGKANEAWEKGTAEGTGEVLASGVGAIAGTLAAPFVGPLGGSLVAKGVEKSVKGKIGGLTQGAIDIGQAIQEEGVLPVVEKGYNYAQRKWYGYEDFGPPKPEEFTVVQGERLKPVFGVDSEEEEAEAAKLGKGKEEVSYQKEASGLFTKTTKAKGGSYVPEVDPSTGSPIMYYEDEYGVYKPVQELLEAEVRRKKEFKGAEVLEGSDNVGEREEGLYEAKGLGGQPTGRFFESIGPEKYIGVPKDVRTWYSYRRDPYKRGLYKRFRLSRTDRGIDKKETPGEYVVEDGEYVLKMPKSKAPALNPVSEVMFPPEVKSIGQEIGEAVAMTQLASKKKGSPLKMDDDIFKVKRVEAKRPKVMRKNAKGLSYVKKTGLTDDLDKALGPKRVNAKTKKVLTPSEKKYRKKYKKLKKKAKKA